MAPDVVHAQVREATLLGRGGAGFPAGVKWGFCPEGVWPRYLVVNGDESEPGTYKDRLLMERDPHQLIEGCLIAGFGMGAHAGYIYIRGEFIREREALQALPARRTTDYSELAVAVTSSSTIEVKRVLYTVPARLVQNVGTYPVRIVHRNPGWGKTNVLYLMVKFR